MRIQEFSSGGGGGGGGGGVQVNLTKKSSDNLFYRSQMVNFIENYHFSRFQKGGPTVSRGVQLFPGQVQLLIPYSNPYNL